MSKYLIFITILLFPFLCSCDDSRAQDSNLIQIQALENFTADGNFEEWESLPFRTLYADPYGNYPDSADISAGFKIAWKETNLLLYFEIEDDRLVADTLYPWRGDAVEVFLADFRGAEDIVQYSLVTGKARGEDVLYKIHDRRKQIKRDGQEPELQAKIEIDGTRIRMEAELNFDYFSGKDPLNPPAVQIYVDDSDCIPDEAKNQLTWYPLGHSYINSFAAYNLQLTENTSTLIEYPSRMVITDDEKASVYVFGTQEGDRIKIMSGDSLIHITRSSRGKHSPEVLEFSLNGTDDDHFRLLVNENPVFVHETFLAPRKYEHKERKRFDREIRTFRMMDRMRMPDPGGVLFIGSSSIRMWNSVQEDFPEINVIHRGFGGSTSADALYYMDHIVLPYKPSVIVYYEGDNDIPGGMSFEEIIENMKDFIERARKQNPEIQLYLLSPKPSPGRAHLWDKYLELHRRMIELTNEYSSVYFVDVSSDMFGPDGSLRKDLFLEDGIHMNDKGYEIWKNILREELGLSP
jgi:lysophospholipase L1-like esterase